MNDQVVEDTLDVSVGARIQQVLSAKQTRQADLVRRTGVSSGYISEVLRGHKRASTTLLVALRRELGVSIDWLLTGEGAMFGGVQIRHDLLRTIQLELAVAAAALVHGDAEAAELMRSVEAGLSDFQAAASRFPQLMSRVMPDYDVDDAAIQIYNSQIHTTDPANQQRNIAVAALGFWRSAVLKQRLLKLTQEAAEAT